MQFVLVNIPTHSDFASCNDVRINDRTAVWWGCPLYKYSLDVPCLSVFSHASCTLTFPVRQHLTTSHIWLPRLDIEGRVGLIRDIFCLVQMSPGLPKRFFSTTAIGYHRASSSSEMISIVFQCKSVLRARPTTKARFGGLVEKVWGK